MKRDPQPSAGVVDSQGSSRAPLWEGIGEVLRRRKEGERHSKRHILVDTQGLVLKAMVHSAKVMDFERGSRRS
jgi:hypothetical protein